MSGSRPGVLCHASRWLSLGCHPSHLSKKQSTSLWLNARVHHFHPVKVQFDVTPSRNNWLLPNCRQQARWELPGKQITLRHGLLAIPVIWLSWACHAMQCRPVAIPDQISFETDWLTPPRSPSARKKSFTDIHNQLKPKHGYFSWHLNNPFCHICFPWCSFQREEKARFQLII